ncbi:unnamed protein product [Adineta steineri]|uniref:Protein wntless n=1 Tax=Adineta steineri TaxID=433720 RepID=A0A815M8H7_9BILA|nr:unnamed protein product [Adineta steineri]CAF1415933.1 unnamed protein product [Adineta steineri]CAF1437331.1 unnamed protein product [Adineta steineri]
MAYLVLLEQLTRKKLLIFLVCLIIIQIIYFLVGGLIATKPTHAANHEFSVCQTKRNTPWIYHREKGNCHEDQPRLGSGKSWKDFVYVIQLPPITRWFQTLTSIIVPHLEYDPKINLSSNAVLTYDVRLGYKTDEMYEDINSEWKLEAQSRESRFIQCEPIYSLPEHKIKNIPDAYSCEPLAFLELSTLKYPHYLINLQIVDENGLSQNIGKLTTFEFVGIYQMENFTKVWYTLKTITFPIILLALIWFCRQMKRSQKPYTNLDKLLFLLGLSACILNAPVEWLTLIMPFNGFQIYSEIRQGFFLTVLLTFWLFFAGEHSVDKNINYSFWSYGKYLGLLWFASSILLIFALCQRGFQLWNPFHSIWSTAAGRNASLTFLVLAGLSSFVYILCLLVLVIRVFWNIRSKQGELAAMRRIRRLMYQGAFYRFQFLLLSTLLCAILTIVWYCLSQIYETEWVWDTEKRPKIHYSGAFITGIYGMLNIYVFAVLILFSPVISNVDDMDALTNDDGNTIHLTNNQTSAYEMITKAAIS